MRLAISNIAWDVAEDGQVAELLRDWRVDAVDVAPGKYLPNPSSADPASIGRVRRWWEERGIEITGMQALLFGTTGLNVFGGPASRDALLAHMDAVCRIGAGLGARRLVFGSPRNRDRGALGWEEAEAVAVEFFRRLGAIAAGHGVVVCVEPNPPLYDCNFMVDSAEAAQVVRRVAHPSIRLQLDTGALAINGEDPEAVLTAHGDLVGHAHASEPQLVPLGDGNARHAEVAAALARHPIVDLISIEMVATKLEPHLVSIERALLVADRFYRAGRRNGEAT